MSERCHNDPLDTADNVCDSCYGSFCSDCLVTLRTKPHPICKDCALILSGVRGTRKPKIVGDRRTAKQRRKDLKEKAKDPKYFTFFDDKDDTEETPESETESKHEEIQSSPLDKIHAVTATSPLDKIRNLAPPVSVEEIQEIEPPISVGMPESQDELVPNQEQEELDTILPNQVEEVAVSDVYPIPELEMTETIEEEVPVIVDEPVHVADEQPKEFDAIEEFDLGLETTSVRHKKNERMAFKTQVEAIPLPDPTHVTIEQLAAAKEQPVIATPDVVTPLSPKDYIKLGTFDKSVIDLANASYTGPTKKLPTQKMATPDVSPPVEEKTLIRQQIDAIPEPPSHRRLHQKENTAEVPAVLNNVHPSELQREETFETRTMQPEKEKVEAFVGAPAEETDDRGVYIPPALRGKEYNDSPLPKRRRGEE